MSGVKWESRGAIPVDHRSSSKLFQLFLLLIILILRPSLFNLSKN